MVTVTKLKTVSPAVVGLDPMLAAPVVVKETPPPALSQVVPANADMETMPTALPPDPSLNERIDATKPNPAYPAGTFEGKKTFKEQMQSVPWYWYVLGGIGVAVVLWKTGVLTKIFGNVR